LFEESVLLPRRIGHKSGVMETWEEGGDGGEVIKSKRRIQG